MKTLFMKSTLHAALILFIVACGGGGGVAGIGGSGFITVGTVTGFGSVYVNGVKYKVGGAVFDIDDSGSGSQDDLAIGMVVTVKGTVNANGVTGTASSISFDDQLQGPVSNLTAPDLDGDNRTFTVLGTTVNISAVDTVFDVSGNLIAPNFDFDTIENGDHVEISGFFNTARELVATRVELKAIAFNINSDIVELKGNVSGFSAISLPFGLEGLTAISIDASGAAIDDLPNGLSDGASVEVKGTCATISCSTIDATRVEGQNDFDDANKISVEGLITDFVDSSNFKINGIDVDASGAILLPSTLVLRDGLRVEVEGPISNNAIQARTIELRGGNAKVHATVDSFDPVTGNFAVNINSDRIAVTVTTATELETPVAFGNFVRVRGFENDTGGITATRVEVRSSADDVIVQGDLQNFVADFSIQLLGVTFDVDYSGGAGETEFEDSLDQPILQSLFESLAPVGTLVKVKDKNGSGIVGVADEIDIETP